MTITDGSPDVASALDLGELNRLGLQASDAAVAAVVQRLMREATVQPVPVCAFQPDI